MNGWISVPYGHQEANTEPLWIGISSQRGQQPDTWVDAFRDIQNGQRVLTAPIEVYGTVAVWVKDSAGARFVDTIRR